MRLLDETATECDLRILQDLVHDYTKPSHHLPSCGENGHSVTIQLSNHNVLTIFCYHGVIGAFQTTCSLISADGKTGIMKGLPLMGTLFMPTDQFVQTSDPGL